jgi:hypothetical protein
MWQERTLQDSPLAYGTMGMKEDRMPSLWLTGADGTLVPLEAQGYVTEGSFQEMLAANPAVLAGATDGADGDWLLIDRELPIKASESDVGTWSLDHLFISRDGRPVLVEVKRSSDPRARREVVAQMLDYAASFAHEWGAERLRGRLAQRLPSTEARATEVEAFLARTTFETEDEFWIEVQTKIEAGQLRLIFVADRLSPTLVRIIEYLNDQLKTTEMLGIEVVRHAATSPGGIEVYQPVVRGQSTEAGRRKSTARRRTKDEFDDVVISIHGEQVLAGVDKLVEMVKALGGFESLGTSEANPVLYLNLHTNGGPPVYWPFLFRPRGDKLIVRIQKLRTHPAFVDEDSRAELLAKIADVAGAPVQGNVEGNPWIPLHLLADAGVVEQMGEVLAWIKQRGDDVAG